jgi:hypothetical protein
MAKSWTRSWPLKSFLLLFSLTEAKSDLEMIRIDILGLA